MYQRNKRDKTNKEWYWYDWFGVLAYIRRTIVLFIYLILFSFVHICLWSIRTKKKMISKLREREKNLYTSLNVFCKDLWSGSLNRAECCVFALFFPLLSTTQHKQQHSTFKTNQQLYTEDTRKKEEVYYDYVLFVWVCEFVSSCCVLFPSFYGYLICTFRGKWAFSNAGINMYT